MKLSVFFAGVAVLVVLSSPSKAWEPTKEAKSVEEVVAKLKEHGLKARQVPEKDRTAKALAGHYSTGPGLSGNELYLFSDSTYIYTEWADILPETIYEKGTWSVKDGFIALKSDGAVPGGPHAREDHYAPLLMKDLEDVPWRPGDGSDVFLMGSRWYFSYFLDHAGKYADSMFYICTMYRKEKPSKDEQEKLRKSLMEKAWRPEFFQNDKDNKGK